MQESKQEITKVISLVKIAKKLINVYLDVFDMDRTHNKEM